MTTNVRSFFSHEYSYVPHLLRKPCTRVSTFPCAGRLAQLHPTIVGQRHPSIGPAKPGPKLQDGGVRRSFPGRAHLFFKVPCAFDPKGVRSRFPKGRLQSVRLQRVGSGMEA